MPLQERYSINYKQSLLLTLLAFAADIYAIPAILRNKETISDDELRALDRAVVAPIDQYALRQDYADKDRCRRISDHLLRASIGLIGLLFISKKMRQQWRQILLLYAETHAVTYTIYSFTPIGPAFSNRYRPVVYYEPLPTAVRNKGNNRNSMYSGHTGNAACAGFFMAKVLNDLHPKWNNRQKAFGYLLALLPAVLVGRFRIKALKHFPSDILLAIAIGAACGILTPELHKRK